jgi:hypothetical protein
LGVEKELNLFKGISSEGGILMNLELNDKEKEILKHALETYLSDLREEIVKTEAHQWKPPLHEEEDVIKKIIGNLS